MSLCGQLIDLLLIQPEEINKSIKAICSGCRQVATKKDSKKVHARDGIWCRKTMTII